MTFSPLAWLKLQYFCHAGNTEVGGFGISAADDLLYIEDFATVRQQVSALSVSFFDDAVADLFDECVDAGLEPKRFSRLWLHTHPGASVTPSATDEDTFARVFGDCDWALMFILGRTGNTYARLAFHTEPHGQFLVPSAVDWEALPMLLDERSGVEDLADRWRREFADNVKAVPLTPPSAAHFPGPTFPDLSRMGAPEGHDLSDFWFDPLEDSNPHEFCEPPF